MMWAMCSALLSRAEKLLVYIAATSLFITMLIVVLDVIMRYGFNSPLSWSYELIAMYMLVMVFFFSLSNTLESNVHIAVDIVHLRLKPRTRYLFLAIGYWLSLFFFFFVVWTSFEETWISYVRDEVTDGLIEWPMWLSWLSVPIGVSLLTLRVLFRAVGYTVSAIENKQYIELPPVSGRDTD